jgi:hypothetical protein
VYEELPHEIPVDEERVPGYNAKYFYPANPGDILENRYQPGVKLGWGSSSTVWLVHDVRRYLLLSLEVARSSSPIASYRTRQWFIC